MTTESSIASGSEPASVKPVRPGARIRRSLRILKWFLLVLCLGILVAYVYNLRKSVIWHSSGIRYEVYFSYGAVSFGWRPEGWRLESEKHPAAPGCRIAYYGWTGIPKLIWWPRRTSNRSWEGLSIPLWIPLLALAIPTGLLWYCDRAGTRDSFERWKTRLRPKRRLKLTLRMVAGLAILHFICVLSSLVFLIEPLWNFLMYPRYDLSSPSFSAVTDWVRPLLIWAAPAWGLLWAWAYVRLRNRLFDNQPVPHCRWCGYNLTGNTSGICPECGVSIAENASNAAAAR